MRDLDVAARRFERDFGLESVPGGRHAAWGTGNRIVPLGEEYIELISPVDPDVAEANALGRWLLAGTAARDRLMGWAVATDDIEGEAERLGLAVVTGSRTRPDGTVLSWRLAGTERMILEPSHPLLLQWDVPAELHPARRAGAPEASLGRIASVGLSGDEASIGEWLGGQLLPLRVAPGDPAIVGATFESTGREIHLE